MKTITLKAVVLSAAALLQIGCNELTIAPGPAVVVPVPGPAVVVRSLRPGRRDRPERLERPAPLERQLLSRLANCELGKRLCIARKYIHPMLA